MHTAEQVAAFSSGEKRLVYAARLDDPTGPLVYLQPGTANEARAYTKANLRCFLSECPSPALTTVDRSRTGRRDGYRHEKGGDHPGESLFHRQGKQALIDWLETTHSEVTATAEVPLPGRTRVVDVMATTPTTQIALEVQYASLDADGTPHSWQQRTRDYEAAGLSAEWFFGHHGHHMAVTPDGIWLNAVHRAVLAAGKRLWWINPTERQVAIPYTVAHIGRRTFELPPSSADRVVQVWIDDLHSLTLTDTGVRSPRLNHLDAQVRARDEAIERERAREEAERARSERRRAEEAARAEQRRQEQVEAAARRQESRQRREARARERLAAQQQREIGEAELQTAVWEKSRTRAGVLAAHDGQIPEHLDLPSDGRGINGHRQHWQSIIYGVVMRDRVGQTATVDDCVAALSQHGIRNSFGQARGTVKDWLLRLQGLDLVALADDNAFTVTDPALVRAQREAAAHTEEQRREAEQAALRAERLRKASGRAAAWESSSMRQVVVDRFESQAIRMLQPARYDVDEGIEGAPEHWRAITLLTIADRPRLVSVSTCFEQVSAHVTIGDPEKFERALRGWLMIVSTGGYITPLPHHQYRATERLTALDRTPPQPELPPLPPRPERPPRPPEIRCTVCGLHIDPLLAASGAAKHVACPASPARTEVVRVRRQPRSGRIRTCKGCANPLDADCTDDYHSGCEPWRVLAARYAPTGRTPE